MLDKIYKEGFDCILVNGDCRTVIAAMADESFSLVIADPPFLLNLPIVSRLLQVGRLLRGDGFLYLFLPNHLPVFLKGCLQTIEEYGFSVVAAVPIYKEVGIIVCCFKGRWYKDKCSFDYELFDELKTLSVTNGFAAGDSHKSPEMMEYMIKAGTRKNELVLDPFHGHGTTARAALKYGRRVIGMELDGDLHREVYDELTKEFGKEKKICEICLS